MSNRWITYGIAALSLIFIQASCKSTKIGGTADCPKKKVEELEPVLRKDLQKEFSFLYSKISVKVEDTKKTQSFKTTLRMRPDSAMSGNVKVAGIIGASYLIDQDSFAYKHRLNKCYKKESFQTLTDMFGTKVGYEFAQQLMLGQAVGEQEFEEFFPIKDDNFYVLGSHDRKVFDRLKIMNLSDEEKQEIYIKYYIDCASLEIAKIEIQAPKDDSKIYIDFIKRQEVNGIKLPEETKVKIISGTDSTMIDLNYGTITLDEPRKISLSIPSSYSECE